MHYVVMSFDAYRKCGEHERSIRVVGDIAKSHSRCFQILSNCRLNGTQNRQICRLTVPS